MGDREKNADEIIEETMKEIYRDVQSLNDNLNLDADTDIDVGNFDDEEFEGVSEDDYEEDYEEDEVASDEEETPFEEEPVKKRGKKKAAVIAAIIIGVLILVYAGFAIYFESHFMFSTKINGTDVSMKSVEQVEAYMEKQVADYELTLKESDGDKEQIDGTDISLKYVRGDELKKLAKQQNNLFWIQSLWKTENIEAEVGVEYNESALNRLIDNLNCLKEENQTASVDAHPEFQTDQFVVVPEVIGTQINRDIFDNAVKEAINGFQAELDLTKTGCYYAPKYVSDSKEVVEATEAMNSYLGACVTYDFNPYTEVVDSSVISQWVKVDGEMQVTFDEASVRAYIQSLAEKYNTKGKQRTFVTATGNTVTVSGGGYGWQIDQEAEYNALIANIQNAETVTREPNYSSRAASHEGNDVGGTYAEVDLTNQVMYFVQNGQVVLQSGVVTGNPNRGNATPQGVYSLAYKALNQTLRGTKRPDGTYEYETPVKYWMPFNGGIGFHDAPWQASFGGSRYQTNGSHGCVNMPTDAAAQLYNLISAGTPVVVHF
ncbi:L,D-transpeptidase family protein [Faecalicatena contorta]|uniref:L,D-transpeptidase family protein n=1 Tax=Faecalicatena contorta TaxID=39482 RepID=UPI001F2A8407|nr:L,D-transpeptidase family protein [Faecalicatena contorta]MCF2681684.1 peptidoglycan binding domain-containing protein [Faecalicatena contorta]